MSNGIVLYRGPSMIDGAPIVLIATGLEGKASRNEKTGGLIQTWIIRADMSPVDAIHSGADASICGSCEHRGAIVDGRNVGRSCYVTVFQAPLVVFKAFQRGLYPEASGADARALLAGRRVRMGAYGDPAAVPFDVWANALADTEARTGYTHQWRNYPEFAAYCMASCDSAADYEAATAAGWRTFRVRRSTDPMMPREIACPAAKESGAKTTCAACVACGGHAAKARANISIVAHGMVGKVNAFAARIAA
jgi:hypothetical protein